MPLKRAYRFTLSNTHRVMAAAAMVFTAAAFVAVCRHVWFSHGASGGPGPWWQTVGPHLWILLAGGGLAWAIWFLAGVNISRLRQSEEALMEREKALQGMADIFNLTTAGLFTMPAHEEKFERVNHAYAAMHGYTLDETHGVSSLDWVAPDFREKARKGRRVSPLAAHMGHEVEHLRKDGTVFPALENVRARIDGQGRLQGFIVNVVDITKRKRAEAENHRLGVYLKSILDHAPFAVIAADVRGQIDFFNLHAEKLLGYSQVEVVGNLTPLHFHVAEEVESRIQGLSQDPASEVPAEFAPFLSLLKLKGPALAEDWHLTSKDGLVIQVQARFSTIADETGRVLGYLEVLEDVSEKRRLEAEKGLYQRMSALGQLAAGIAHEINTPMQFISDNVAFFQDNFFNLLKAFDALARRSAQENACVSGDEIREIFERADYEYTKLEIPKAIKQTIDGAARVNEIVSSLKNLSHLDSPDLVSVDCNQLLRDALVVTRNVWQKVATATETFDPELPLVEAIPGELSQVFINLILNAVFAMGAKALPEKGALGLRTRQADSGTIEVSVSDTGTGIPAAVQEKVFEPFFTTKPFGQGTGQGLFLARKIIVEKYQGKIFFTTSPQGTTFFIQLPHKHPKPAPKPEPVLTR